MCKNLAEFYLLVEFRVTKFGGDQVYTARQICFGGESSDRWQLRGLVLNTWQFLNIGHKFDCPVKDDAAAIKSSANHSSYSLCTKRHQLWRFSGRDEESWRGNLLLCIHCQRVRLKTVYYLLLRRHYTNTFRRLNLNIAEIDDTKRTLGSLSSAWWW